MRITSVLHWITNMRIISVLHWITNFNLDVEVLADLCEDTPCLILFIYLFMNRIRGISITRCFIRFLFVQE